MSIIKEYLRLAVFAAGLLLGVQIPAFIDQYHKRVDAHLLEAQHNLAGFTLTAQRYFGGDIQQLIAHYLNSEDEVFRRDAISIEQIYQRQAMLTKQWEYLQLGPVKRTFYLLAQYNPSILHETLNQYSYTVPLTPEALGWGIVLALFLAAVFDGSLGLCSKGCTVCYQLATRRRPT